MHNKLIEERYIKWNKDIKVNKELLAYIGYKFKYIDNWKSWGIMNVIDNPSYYYSFFLYKDYLINISNKATDFEVENYVASLLAVLACIDKLVGRIQSEGIAFTSKGDVLHFDNAWMTMERNVELFLTFNQGSDEYRAHLTFELDLADTRHLLEDRYFDRYVTLTFISERHGVEYKKQITLNSYNFSKLQEFISRGV